MKRAISALAVCAVMLLALAGCRAASSSSSAQTGSTSSSTPDVSVSSSAAASTSSVPAKSVASGTAAARDEIDDGAFDDMMDALAGYQPGTSGASLKLYTAACGVLNFAEGYGDGQEQALRGALEQTLSSMDKAGREALADAFPMWTPPPAKFWKTVWIPSPASSPTREIPTCTTATMRKSTKRWPPS